MFLSKDFFEFYSKLPPKDDFPDYGFYYNGNNFWTVSLNTLNNILERDVEAMAKIWQALIFSLFKKVLFNHSRNNYLYTNHFIKWKYGSFQQDDYIYREKLTYFFEILIPKINFESQQRFRLYSEENIELFAKELYDMFLEFDKNAFQYNFLASLKNTFQSNSVKDEFSNDQGSISYKFYQSFLKLINN